MPLGDAYPSAFSITKANVRFRMVIRALWRPRLNYEWATSALETFRMFTSTREAREVQVKITRHGTLVAELQVKWLD